MCLNKGEDCFLFTLMQSRCQNTRRDGSQNAAVHHMRALAPPLPGLSFSKCQDRLKMFNMQTAFARVHPSCAHCSLLICSVWCRDEREGASEHMKG